MWWSSRPSPASTECQSRSSFSGLTLEGRAHRCELELRDVPQCCGLAVDLGLNIPQSVVVALCREVVCAAREELPRMNVVHRVGARVGGVRVPAEEEADSLGMP